MKIKTFIIIWQTNVQIVFLFVGIGKKRPYFNPFNKTIYTGEFNINNFYVDKERIEYFNLNNFVPLKLRANESPEMIGKYKKNIIRDYCFMGSGYKKINRKKIKNGIRVGKIFGTNCYSA